MTWRDRQRWVLASVLVVLTGLCASSGPVRAQAPATPPTLVLLTNQPAFGPGAGLSLTLGLQHAGASLAADLYFGVILPDGVSVVYFEGLGLATRRGRLNDLTSIRPMLSGLTIATGTNIVVPDFFRYTWQGSEPQGAYQFFFAATRPGALRDGRVDGGDLLAMKTQSILNLPPATITTDAGRAGSAQVGPGGGTVVATAADGTLYTLTVPPGALGAPTTITLTPMASLTGLPVPVTLAAGVKGAPDGLNFALPATLVVDLAHDPQLGVFAMPMPDNGAGFEVVPVARNGRRLTLQVEHFSVVAIPESTDALISLMVSTSNFMRAWQLLEDAGPDYSNPSPAAVQAALNFMVTWYEGEIFPQGLAAVADGATDDQRLAFLAEFLAWDNSRATLEQTLGSVTIGGQPVRGQLTGRASTGRVAAAVVLADGYRLWNDQCRALSGLVPDRLRLAVRAARFAVLTELYLAVLDDNQDSADVSQATPPDRDAVGISPQQIASSYCLLETIEVTEPAPGPGQTGELLVKAGTRFGAEPTAFGEFMEIAYQPAPNATEDVRPTDAQGEARFTVTADANGRIGYFVCATFPGELEPAGWITLYYRVGEEPCRSSVAGVIVTPSQTEIMPGQSRQFTAVVEGTANQVVAWSVTGGGTITQNGLFTSNGTLGTFFVMATSVEDPNSVGIAQVTVTLPCTESACSFSGTWNRCETRSSGTVICENFTTIFSDPQVRVFPETAGPAALTVSFTCPRSSGSTLMAGTIQMNGAFTASQLSGSNVCVLGSMTGTLTPDTLNFTIVNAFDANVTFGFSGTR